jgi:DNA polymerase-3 subunit alpha
MLFADRLKQLQEMNLEEPIAIKAKITHTDMFTRIGVTKLISLKDAKKESKKTKTEIVEKILEPITIQIKLDNNFEKLDKLHKLVVENPGKHKLVLIVTSKLQNIVLTSSFLVDKKILKLLEDDK